MNRPALEALREKVATQAKYAHNPGMQGLLSGHAGAGDLRDLLDALLAPDAASANITGLVSMGAPRIPLSVYDQPPRPVALWETAG